MVRFQQFQTNYAETWNEHEITLVGQLMQNNIITA